MYRGGTSTMKPLGTGEDLILTTVKSEPRVHSPCEKDMVPSGSSQTNSLFSSISNSNKRSRTDDWLSPPSPGPPMGNAPLTPSPGPHNQYTVISNGYSSPTMSSGSYDPYSPNGKLGEWMDDSSRTGYLVCRPCDSLVFSMKKLITDRDMTDLYLSTTHFGIQNKIKSIKNDMVEESSPEVTSSCGRLSNSDFRDVDLELWDLDVNNHQRNQILHGHGGVLMRSMKTYSETSSMSGRDDLSPSGSINGYSVDSSEAKKKKGPTPRQQEELCLVCGDRASGYHYNALTCEGCKGFFRRSITKNAVYQCKYGDSCEIDMYMRRKCQECRLKKCLSVGMRPECVVPEIQCEVKRREKKAQREKGKPNSTTNGSPDLLMVDTPVIKTEPNTTQPHSDKAPTNGVKPISPEQEELIHRLVYFQNEYEQPSDEDLKRISNAPTDGEDQSDLRFRHITEITILTVQLIVEFAKRLPGFDKLLREDQIALLKACSSEVMMLRMARRYDVQSDSILFANNQPYTRDSYSLAGMGETVDDLLRFCRQMYAMKVDNAEYALLTAIVIFSERPSLIEGWKVEKIQEIYVEALKVYVDNRRKPRSGTIFAKLISVLTELRTLGNQNSEMCFSFKLKNKKLPPFLAEIWDVIP